MASLSKETLRLSADVIRGKEGLRLEEPRPTKTELPRIVLQASRRQFWGILRHGFHDFRWLLSLNQIVLRVCL